MEAKDSEGSADEQDRREDRQRNSENHGAKERSVSSSNKSKETKSSRGDKRDFRSKSRQSSRSIHKTIKHNRRKAKDSTPEKQAHLANHPRHKRKSTNPFINFVQDYRKDFPNMVMNRNAFQLCSERWKHMSDDQKQPYIEAANTVKNCKRINEVRERPSKKISLTRIPKRKTVAKKKEIIQKRSKVNKPDAKSNSDINTDTTVVHSSTSDADVS